MAIETAIFQEAFMFRKLAALSTALAACALAACGGGGMGHAGNPGALPMTVHSFQVGDDMVADVNLPKNTVGEELPGEGVGTVKDKAWGMVGGFTQMTHAQVLAFPPGTKITIRNLSKTTQHTFDVVAKTSHGPAKFPSKGPSINAQGGKTLAVGYASGPINPGKFVTLTLSKPGTYLIECAFHYGEGMQDVLIVEANAKPGPQGTPMPKATATASSMPTSSPPGGGW
jgi:plastocyanin